VLRLMGDGAWELHEAGTYRFDGPAANLPDGPDGVDPGRAMQVKAAG
jgi:putative ATP-binding cassette transporter